MPTSFTPGLGLPLVGTHPNTSSDTSPTPAPPEAPPGPPEAPPAPPDAPGAPPGPPGAPGVPGGSNRLAWKSDTKEMQEKRNTAMAALGTILKSKPDLDATIEQLKEKPTEEIDSDLLAWITTKAILQSDLTLDLMLRKLGKEIDQNIDGDLLASAKTEAFLLKSNLTLKPMIKELEKKIDPKFLASAKVKAILESHLDPKAVVEALEEEIEATILASIVTPGGRKSEQKSSEELSSILQGCIDLYEPKVVTGNVRLASKAKDLESLQPIQEAQTSAMRAEIANIEQEIKNLERDIQSSTTYKKFIEQLEREIEPLTGNAEAHKNNLIEYEKKKEEEILAATSMKNPELTKKIATDIRLIVRKLANEKNKKDYKEYNEKQARLDQYRALKSQDRLPLPLGISVSMQYCQLAKLISRSERLTAGQEIEVNADPVLKLRNSVKAELRKDLKVYYEALTRQKVALMIQEKIKGSSPVTESKSEYFKREEEGLRQKCAVEVITEMSNAHRQYQERLQAAYPREFKDVQKMASDIESTFTTITKECKTIAAQEAFNKEAELSEAEAAKMLQRYTKSISDGLTDIEMLADNAIERELSIQEGDIKTIAASIKANAISTVAEELGAKKKVKAVVVVQVAEKKKELVTQASKESNPIIFNFNKDTTLYTVKEQADLARYFGYELNVQTINEDLNKLFEVFRKNPSDPNQREIQNLKISLNKCGDGAKELQDNEGLMQPREWIQKVLKITDINFELEKRQKEKAQQKAQLQAMQKAELQAAATESKNDDVTDDENAVVFHAPSGTSDTDSETSDTEAGKAVGKMLASAAELEAMSAKLANVTRQYQQERAARQEEQEARERETKARQEAERQKAEIIAKIAESPMKALEVLSPEQATAARAAAQALTKAKLRRG